LDLEFLPQLRPGRLVRLDGLEGSVADRWMQALDLLGALQAR
jgi:hypothetical protein